MIKPLACVYGGCKRPRLTDRVHCAKHTLQARQRMRKRGGFRAGVRYRGRIQDQQLAALAAVGL